MTKQRIDKLLVERGFMKSRERARAVLMAGRVVVGGVRVEKPGTFVPLDASISVKEGLPYVGRGGIKLRGALDHFNIDVSGMSAMDVGSSTGGFTDCLLQAGAVKVFAVDVGVGQLAWRLRTDERVRLLEGRNIRYLRFDDVGEHLDMAVVDVSFISLKKVLPCILHFLKEEALLLALIKPQFEVGKGEVGKGGIVRDVSKHRFVIKEIEMFTEGMCLRSIGVMESPLAGTKGNREFWIGLVK